MCAFESDKSYLIKHKLVFFSEGLKSQDRWQLWLLIAATTK